MKDGKMVEDFMLRQTPRMLHVVNAPSPAATSSMPIADYLTAKMLDEEPTN
jgi:L-2-hydroxyglutarate oxidase